MTQEDKELLLKDLCARLPYGVKCEGVKRSIDGEVLFIRNGSAALELTVNNVKELVTNNMYEIKPYLFPLSSMTEEHQKEEYNICAGYIIGYESNLIDFYNKYHYDYRGLIPMGLAEDATDKNIY
jgi:hypothetical protein